MRKVEVSWELVNYFLLALEVAKQNKVRVGANEFYEIAAFWQFPVKPKIIGPVLGVMMIYGLVDIKRFGRKPGFVVGKGRKGTEKQAHKKMKSALAFWEEEYARKNRCAKQLG
jgi:hypothetical protein